VPVGVAPSVGRGSSPSKGNRGVPRSGGMWWWSWGKDVGYGADGADGTGGVAVAVVAVVVVREGGRNPNRSSSAMQDTPKAGDSSSARANSGLKHDCSNPWKNSM
jgi:hypothetical protein